VTISARVYGQRLSGARPRRIRRRRHLHRLPMPLGGSITPSELLKRVGKVESDADIRTA